ncbi:MAG: DUF2207 domain-containing protein, partial [Bacteroidetes bacterium]|nr:DUF2207 domain-containing protein [Bacteroidota bacterium]
GNYGESDKKDFVTYSPSSEKQVFMTDKLYPGNNLTVAVVFDKDVMSEIPFTTEMIYFFRDNSLLIIGVLGFIITFIINLILWMKYGKDPKKGTIIPQYYAPEGWSPAEVLYLMNNGEEDDNMFAAQLLQLAVKGHIKIDKKDSKSGKDIFVISHADNSSNKQPLTELEKGFFDMLLGNKAYTIIREKYNPRVSLANRFLLSRIEKKQAGVYFRKNKRLFLAQYLAPIATIITMIATHNYYEGIGFLIPITAALMIIMNLIFKRLFYQPTLKGRKMLDHILGLKRYIKYADELRIKATNKPDMNFDFFERNLPYAVAFGKADEWGEKFSGDVAFPKVLRRQQCPGCTFHISSKATAQGHGKERRDTGDAGIVEQVGKTTTLLHSQIGLHEFQAGTEQEITCGTFQQGKQSKHRRTNEQRLLITTTVITVLIASARTQGLQFRTGVVVTE